MILFFVYPIVVIILAVLVVLQPSGLGAVDMFSGGRSSSVFSVKSSKSVMSKATILFVAIFFVMTFLLSGFYIKKAKDQQNIISHAMKDELMGINKPVDSAKSKVESDKSTEGKVLGKPAVKNHTVSGANPRKNMSNSDAGLGDFNNSNSSVPDNNSVK